MAAACSALRRLPSHTPPSGRSGCATREPSTNRSTMAVASGSVSDSGRELHSKRPETRVAAGRRGAGWGCRPRRRPAAGAPLSRTSRGQCLGIAGQLHPAFGIDLPALGEGAAACIDGQRQALRPHAAEFVGVDRLARLCVCGRRERAAAELLAVQHPALPFAQAGGMPSWACAAREQTRNRRTRAR